MKIFYIFIFLLASYTLAQSAPNSQSTNIGKSSLTPLNQKSSIKNPAIKSPSSTKASQNKINQGKLEEEANENDPNEDELESNFIDEELIDSTQLYRYSRPVYRYNTRTDKIHSLRFLGLGGKAEIDKNPLNYFGGIFSYDGAISTRYPIGFMLGYATAESKIQDVAESSAQSQNLLDSSYTAHTAQIGFYGDMFIEAHHIAFLLSQSLNLINYNTSPESKTWLNATTTSFSASYGYVLGRSSSFLEPFGSFYIHNIFHTNKRDINLPNYSLRSSLEIGATYTQYMGHYVRLRLSPSLLQNIGVIGFSLPQILSLNTNGAPIFALPNSKYLTYGALSAALEIRFGKRANLSINAQGLYSSNILVYGGSAWLNILF